MKRTHAKHFLLLLVVVVICHRTVTAEAVQYRPVQPDIVEARLNKYGGNDSQRETTLKDLFAEAGCIGQDVIEQSVKGSKLPNVICTMPGSTNKTIIIGAHYDHVRAGDGVVDNWSGASLLPSLYQSLKAVPRKHTYIFIGFTDEERGDIGSHFYSRHMTKEEVENCDAMINMDTLGLAPTEIWATHSEMRLNTALTNVANQLHLPLSAMNVERVGTTDSEQFSKLKIPSITVHSLTQESFNAGILHTAKDKISAINMTDYYQSYRLLSAYIAFLDTFLQKPAAAK